MLFVEKISAALKRVRVSPRAAMLLILLAAFFLRVFRLGAPAIWWDESLSLYRANLDLATIFANTIQIQNVLTTDLQPPLYFLFEHFFVRALGTGEFALRFLSVVASAASVALLYALGARWFNPRVGALAALLGALSPFYVAYAQEARPYALVLFWSLLAIYALTRAFRMERGQTRMNADEKKLTHSHTRTRLWLFAFVFSAVAALYTHYYAVFLFPFYAFLITLLIWNTPRSKKWILVPALPFASIAFLLPIIQRGAASNAQSGPSAVSLPTILFDLLNSFSVGISADSGQMLAIDAAMLVLFAIGVGFPNRGFRISDFGFRIANRELPITNYELRITNYAFRHSLLLLAYLCIPLAALQLATIYRPLYQNSRYFIVISPAFYLGVAAGMASLARLSRLSRFSRLPRLLHLSRLSRLLHLSRLSRSFALFAFLFFFVGAAISLNNLYFAPRYGKDDHRAWAEFLRERVRPDDYLILNSPHTEALFNYYARGVVPYTTLPILRADGAPSSDAENKNILRDVLRQHARVWYLAMHVPFDDPDQRVERFLGDAGVLIEQNSFPGVSTGIALSQYVAAMPVLRNARAVPNPINLRFGSSLRLVGYDAPAEMESGARGIVKLFFQLDQPVGEDYGVSLRVVDNAGAVWGQWDAIPVGGIVGTSTWIPRTIFVHTHDLPIAIGARPGNYQILITVYRASTSRVIGAEKLTGLAITRPRAPTDPAALRATTRLDQTIGAVRVIGADVPARASPGDTIPIALYLQILAKPSAPVAVALQFAERAFPLIGPLTTRAETNATLARDVEAGDIVRQDFDLRMPAEARGEAIARAVIAGETVELGTLRVKELERKTEIPAIARPFSARFGESIELLGYDLSPTRPTPGDALRLTLYWRALKPMPTSYTVFTHLLDSSNQIFGQQDSIPVSGSRPTTGWIAGEVIVDSYTILLNPATPRGSLQIEIGFYDAATGARLPVQDAGDHLLLPGLQVQ